MERVNVDRDAWNSTRDEREADDLKELLEFFKTAE